MGVGKTSVQGLTTGDLFVRGLKLSVYVRNDYFPMMTHLIPASDPLLRVITGTLLTIISDST